MSDLTDLTEITENTENTPYKRYGLRARLTTPDYKDGLRKRRPDNNATNNQIIRGQDSGDSNNNNNNSSSSSNSSSTGRRFISTTPSLTSSSKRMRQMQQQQKQQQPVSHLILEKIVNELTTDFESKLVELYHFLLDTNVSYLVLKELNFFEKLLLCLKNPKNQSIFTKVFIKPLNEVNMRKAPFKKIVITLLYFMEKKNYYDCIDLSEDILNQQQTNDCDGNDDDDDASYTYSDILSSIYQHFRTDGTGPPPLISQQPLNSLRPDLKTIVTGNIELRLKYQEDKKLEITTKLFTRFRELANRIKLDDQNCLRDIGANNITRNNDIRNSRGLFTVHERIDDDDDDDDDDDSSEEIYNIHQLIQQQQLEQQHNNPQGQHEHDEDEDDGLNESLTNERQNFGLEGGEEEQDDDDDDEEDREELNELFADQNRLELSGSQINTNEELNDNSNNDNNNSSNDNDNNNNNDEDDEGEYTGDHETESGNVDNENGERSYDGVIEQERIGFDHADENGEYTDEEFNLIEHVEELFYSDRYGIENENNIFYDETTEFQNNDDDATSTISSSSDGQHQSNDFFSYKETHWQFYIGDQRIPLDTTIYAAIHWYMTANSKWNLNQQYEVELKYSSEPFVVDPNLPSTLDCKVIENNKSTLELLKLLHWLYVNMIEGENYQSNLFIFKNMDEVLNEKLKKPIAILTGVYPIWVYSVFHDYRFLVSGRNQLKLFKAQVFGIRMYNERDQDISGFSKREFNIIKRLLPVWKDKEIQTREKVFDWALKQLEKTASLSHKIKIKFKGLGGVGLGVTRDFFTILSEEFFKKNKKMWINNSSVAYEGEYVQPYKSGLYPTLIGEDIGETNENVGGDGFDEDNDTDNDNDGYNKLLNNFKLLGALTSVGLFNNCIVDLNMSKIFLTLLLKDLNENVKYDYGIDEIEGLYEPLVMQLKMINSTDEWSDFYIPSPPAFCEINFEEETDKTAANFQSIFIEYFFNKGVNRQINWYITGFEHLFPFKYLKYLTPTPAEFTYFFCGRTKEDWKLDTLKKYIQKKNQSPISDGDYMMVLRIMSNLDIKDRKQLLRFATGSTRFPIGGWEVLGLNLDAFPTEEEHYYPVGRTCHNCIIVPPNNEEAELKRKLIYAINNQCEIDRD